MNKVLFLMLMFFCINVNADNSFISWSFLTHEEQNQWFNASA